MVWNLFILVKDMIQVSLISLDVCDNLT